MVWSFVLRISVGLVSWPKREGFHYEPQFYQTPYSDHDPGLAVHSYGDCKYDLSPGEVALDRWTPLILLVGITAIVAGVSLLRGTRWARWLIIARLAFHVVISALNSLSDALPHILLLLVVGYFPAGAPDLQVFSE
jgi:hypothetical protein